MKKYLIILICIVIIFLTIFGFLQYKESQKTTPRDSTTTNQTTKSDSQNAFDKSKYSLTDPTSFWVIVNKKNGIPETFVPDLVVPKVKLRLSPGDEQMQINKTTAPAIEELFAGAHQDGIQLVFGSGYRSGALQKQFYDSYRIRDGQQSADTYSARPGHSEHQTGFSADITSSDGKCHLEICWESTPEGVWLKDNSYKYGFIIRYPDNKQSITGYQYEPWHVRYVGKELANEIHKSGQTLEEFFNQPPAPNYD